MKIIFYPPKSNSNDYIQEIVNSIRNNDVDIINLNWNSDLKFAFYILFCSKKKMAKIMHLNRIEENANSNNIKARFKCWLLLRMLRFYKNKGGKIVWTMHNLKSHVEGANDQTIFIHNLLDFCNLVMVHNSESSSILQRKYNYPNDRIFNVPIGNYCRLMDNFPLKKAIVETKPVFLYFGTISKYKGILNLIECFDDLYIKNNSILYVCGSVSDLELKKEIVTKSKSNKSINLVLERVSDSDLMKYFNISSFAIFPFDKESMQNSSSAIMALTCATPIIIPLFGYIRDIKNQDFVFSYDYTDKDSLIFNLKEIIKKCIILFKNDKDYILQLSKKARDFAVSELNWNAISKDIVSHYKNII